MRHDHRHEEMRELAYRLWEKAGRPSGMSHHFWEKARYMLWHARARVREFHVTDNPDAE